MTSYTCFACAEPIQPSNAVIVGLDITEFPTRLPTNIVAHKGCEDQARARVAQVLAAQEREKDK
jgi:hypothetical protein